MSQPLATAAKESRRFVRFRWNYIGMLSPAPVEFDPVLHFYLSGTVKDSRPRMHNLSIADDERLAAIQERMQQIGRGSTGGGMSIADGIVQQPHQPAIGLSMEEYASSYIDPAWYAPEHMTYAEFSWDARESPLLYRDTTLNLDAFAYTYNNKGQLCLAEAGSASVYLSELYQHTAKDGGVSVVLQRTLKFYNAEGLVKGVVVLRVEPDFISATDLPAAAKQNVPVARFPAAVAADGQQKQQDFPSASWFSAQKSSGGGDAADYANSFIDADEEGNAAAGLVVTTARLGFDDIFQPTTDYDYIGENKQLFSDVFRSYIMANNTVFSNSNSQPTWPFMKNIHSPMYRFRGNTVPGLCFVLLNNERATNPEAYYLNLLYITLRRHYKYKTLEQAIEYFEKSANHEETACILAEVACVFSNYCNYMTDKAHVLRDEHTRHINAADRLQYIPHKQQATNLAAGGGSGKSTHRLLQSVIKAQLSGTADAAAASGYLSTGKDGDERALFDSSSSEFDSDCDCDASDEAEAVAGNVVRTVAQANDNDGQNSAEEELFSEAYADEQDDGDGDTELAQDATHFLDAVYHEFAAKISAAADATAMSGGGGDGGGGGGRNKHVRSKRVSSLVAQRVNDQNYVKLIESFSTWLRSTGTGDCEDMAREILRHLRDLKIIEFQSPLLRKLQRIRREYVPLQTLKGVSSGAITDSLDDVTELGAHMDITLVHGPYLLRLLENFNSQRPIFEREPEAVAVGRLRDKPLPTLVCEGTGCLKPDGSPDEALACKLYLMRESGGAFDDIKSMLHQPIHQSSSFYKTVQSALVHELIAEGYGIGEIVFFTRHAQRRMGADIAACRGPAEKPFAELIKDAIVDECRGLGAEQASVVPSRRHSAKRTVREMQPVAAPGAIGTVSFSAMINRIGSYDHVEPNRHENSVRELYAAGVVREERERLALRTALKKMQLDTSRQQQYPSALAPERLGEAVASEMQTRDLHATAEILARHKAQPGYIKYNVAKSTLLTQFKQIGSALSTAGPLGGTARGLDKYLHNYYTTKYQYGGGDKDISVAATYGIKHTQLVNADAEQIMAYTMPDVSADEMARFERILAHNHPLEPLDVPHLNTLECEKLRAGGGGNQRLEQLKALARYYNRTADFANQDFVHVDFYFKYDQVNDDDDRFNALKQLFARKKYLVSFDYFEEPVARNNEIGGYLLRFSVVKLRAVHRQSSAM